MRKLIHYFRGCRPPVGWNSWNHNGMAGRWRCPYCDLYWRPTGPPPAPWTVVDA